jgi:hypothetical protein
MNNNLITETPPPTFPDMPAAQRSFNYAKVAAGVAVLGATALIILLILPGDESPRSTPALSSSLLDATTEPDSGEFVPETLAGREALTRWIALMESGVVSLSTYPGYTATFERREQVAGTLRDGEAMEITLRHQPFSVHAKWLVGKVGQELLYVEDTDSPHMLVRLGGWKGRMMPALKLDPHGSLAMKSSRYPITEIGLMNLLHKLLDHRRRDASADTLPSCRLDTITSPRPAYRFVIEYKSPEQTPGISDIYRRSIVSLDREWLVPTGIENHGWGTSTRDTTFDDTTLIESYRYRDVDFDAGTSDLDFDRDNPEYAFRR